MTADTYQWDRLGDQIMDTRDLIAVAAEIRDALDDLAQGSELGLEALGSSTGNPDDDEQEAREILAAIEGIESAGITDWQYGEILIREDYFTEYAQELAEDIGAINSEASWPAYCIDWERAAGDLKQDYTEVEYRGTTYYVRS